MKQRLLLLLLVTTMAFFAQAQNLQFAKGFGNSDLLGGTVINRAVAVDPSGNEYIVGGLNSSSDFDNGSGTASLTSAGGSDIFLAKYDASGNYLWAKRIGSTGADIAYGVALDASGNVYITGYFNGTADFDPGTGINNLVSSGSSVDIFLAKYDHSGNYLWAKRIGNTSADISYGVALDATGNAIITGYFQGTVDFDPGTGTVNLTSSGANDLFVAKYGAGTPLPVRWLSVTGNLNNLKQATIKWQVQENSVKEYVVEKSREGGSYTAIGQLSSTGDGVHNYSYLDGTPLSGGAYYRIKQIDLDGRYSYSSVVRLSAAPDSRVQVYPTLFQSGFTVVSPQKQTALLLDATGRTIKTIQLQAGSQFMVLDNLSSGMYLLRTPTNEVIKIQKQ